MLALVLSLLVAESSQGATVTSIPQIGPHTPLFYVEKNQNPENEMVVFAKLDDHCRILPPGFDFYWLMNRQNFKPTHVLIKSSLRKRVQVIPKNDHEYSVQLESLKELEHDLEKVQFNVVAKRDGQGCKLETFFPLGPSDHNVTMRVKNIYVESEFTFLPPFRKVKAITLNGEYAKTHRPLSRRYIAH